jgi:hypothetical protein
MHKPQEVGGNVIGEDRLMVMTGEELVEWYQIHQTHGFQVFYAIPFALFQAIIMSRPPLSSLLWHADTHTYTQ